MLSLSDDREVESVPALARASFRLRHLLALLLLSSVVVWSWPRGLAAWRLYNSAVAYADYALCMVGPTGPRLMQREPDQFRSLVRRRVIAASPSTKPLASCEPLAAQIGVSHSAFRLHGSSAKDFREFGNTPIVSGRVSLEDLDLSLARLATIRAQAWPFVGSRVQDLMKPSSHAKEASYSPRPPVPGVGSGLPATRHLYRSTAAYGDTVVVSLGSGANAQVLISDNGGSDWRRGGRRLSATLRDRCVSGDAGRAFSVSRTRDGSRIVLSHGAEQEPEIAVLASPNEQIAGVSCDARALVVALVLEADATGHRPVRLRLCPYRKPCHDLKSPDMGGDRLYYPVDIARTEGDTIISRTSGGITRVSSSRDDGRTWLPWTIAYDRAVSGGVALAPFRLLFAADQLLLYTGSSDSSPYHQLISTDHGASFRAASTGNAEVEPPITSASILER